MIDMKKLIMIFTAGILIACSLFVSCSSLKNTGLKFSMVHALALFKDEEYENALEELNCILEDNPENEKALSLRAETYFMLKDYKSAYNDCVQLVKKNPKPVYLIHKAETERELEMYADVIEDCKKVLSYDGIADGEAFACWNLLSVSYSECEMYEESLKYYDLVLEKYKHPEVYYERALSYLHLSNFEKALADFEKSIEQASKCSKEYQQNFYSDDFYYYYGACLLGSKKIKEALTSFKKIQDVGSYSKLNEYIQFCEKNK